MMVSAVMDLTRWSIFSLLDPEFGLQIKLACVFGNLGNEAFVVTKSDEVFAVGSNGAGSLGLGDPHSTLQPLKVDALCQKGVKGFAYGSGPHVVAFTDTGEVYAWGHNGYCQVGNGCTNQVMVPALVTGALAGKKVMQVACGSHHSMALTVDGEVFAWGQNNCGQIGVGSTTNQATPKKVAGALAGKQVIQTACGQTSTMAVIENGEVYGWGYNGNGQIGLGNNINQLQPCRVTNLQGVVVKQVACGYAHTLAMSDEGHLYAWGANSYGQLGTGSKTNLCSPTKIAAEIGRVVEVLCSHYAHISVAVTQSSHVYMWGQCKGQCVIQPTHTPFPSAHDAFASYATPAVSSQAMTVDCVGSGKVGESVRQAFDDQDTCDLRFIVEGRPIHVHKSLLKIRCEHFRSMFQDHWEEGDKDEVEITQFAYPVYRAFLHYLYTDEVDLTAEDAIGTLLSLLDLATSYCEVHLKRRCQHIIKQGITINNAAMLYATAIKFEAKELEEFCFRFLLNHMTAVTQTESFGLLDEGTVKAFIQRASKQGAFKS